MTLTAVPPPADPMADQNYRVRRLHIKIDLDVYDADGFLVNRGLTDEIVLNEVEIPADVAATLVAKTSMARGFVARPIAANADAPKP